VIAALWLLPALALGCLMVLCFSGLRERLPKPEAALLLFGAGSATGIGAASCLFFVCRLLLPGSVLLPLLLELAAVAALGVLYVRRPRATRASDSTLAFPLNLALALALPAAVLAATCIMAGTWEANPHGDWDAWSIWNLRARYLAANSDAARRAWSPDLVSTHPEYPLLTSAFVARCWAYCGSDDPAAPIAVSYVFLLALVSAGAGGVGLLRSRPLGLLFGLLLAGTPVLLHAVPAQYADVPLACYFLAALLLALLEEPLFAGVCAGLAAWTKDEGSLFLLVFVAASAVWRLRALPRVLLGAAPGAVLALSFKLLIAAGTPSLAGRAAGTLAPKLLAASRYVQVLKAFAASLLDTSFLLLYLALAVVAASLRFDQERRRDAVLAVSVGGVMLAAYFSFYIVTPYDLAWHLATSLNRLIVQLWPLLLLAVFAALRTPESYAVVTRKRK